jgi:hypothetical protein
VACERLRALLLRALRIRLPHEERAG